MSPTHIQRGTKAPRRAQHVRQLLSVHKADLVVAVLLAQLAGIIAAVRVEPRAVIGVQQPRLIADGYRVLGRKRLNQHRRLDANAVRLARIINTDHLLQLVLLDPLAHARLTPVAPRRAPARPVGIQDHHRPTALGTMQSRTQPGKAPADDADIRLNRARQRRPLNGPNRCGGIVRRGIAPNRVVVLVEQR